ncbi:glycosyltransferase family 2 protein [Meridianimaribacter flavus]|uniref:GT2 family glycosyltransferase n=1 Tax=Meridianimaribacter flavus TaxID=571115 RepID=A0ABY2G4P2_9FLAO|nr:glycosyltransferase family 2 protein [Meridianimaribacter flavus]TDY11789.1 GT2 family glycosyltransferase [Meridianimaribacter flavus]
MDFSLVVCTYMRPKALLNLLYSVEQQTLYPNEILIIDGSLNTATQVALEAHEFANLVYYKVTAENRGLTKQRNFGITKVSKTTDVVCFLDDDTILDPHYFQQLLVTYKDYPDALGVGGYISNEVQWEPENGVRTHHYFYYDGWQRKEPLRFRVRRVFGLAPDTPPCILPSFSHGRSVGFLPPTGKTYQVEQFMGGVASYRKKLFDNLSFSSYFEGYGLYEDADFCLRLSKLGTLYVNTNAQLEHHHEAAGRPNAYKYGKMVLRNGWYIWRIKYPNPSLKARLKWHLTAVLLMKLTVLGVVMSSQKKAALSEGLGRFVGWWTVLFYPPSEQL